jgi:TusA-related sulfurtransferase
MNIVGNIISGQVSGETAKQLSEKFGKILQDRQSIATNRNDTNVTNSKQLELAIPINKISSLSSGEFVGMVADNPDQKIELKAFCSEIINDHELLAREQSNYKELPAFSKVQTNDIFNTYLQVKKDIVTIVQNEIERMLDTPELTDLIIKKE